MLAIKNNIMAANAARHLGVSYDALAKSVERLSSGLRINSAKDDAAGLAVRELMRADIAVLQQGSRNAMDGISMLQTFEGAMGTIDEALVRMKQLAEQAATGSYSSAQRDIMNQEFSEMAAEIDRIAGSTSFNGNDLISATGEDVSIHVGTDEQIAVEAQNMTTASDGLDITTGTGATTLTSSTAGLTADGASFFKYADSVGAAAGVLTITFIDNDAADNETSVAVTFADDTDITLNQLVDAINAVSQNLGNDANGNSLNYAMASVYHDTDTGDDFLKLTSRDGGIVDDATMVVTSTGTADIAGSLGFPTENEADLTVDMGAAAIETGISIDTAANALIALDAITAAITTKDTARASFGYKMNRLESTISILNIQSENLLIAESRISDVDVATEMAAMTRNQVLAQAGISMLAQANAMPQLALSLLR
jgi:flagellin